MTTLATVSDVEIRLGRSLNGTETTKAEAMLLEASALATSYTGQKFLTGNSTNLVRLNGTKATLGQRPVTAINDVTNVDGDPIPFTWDGYQSLTFEPGDLGYDKMVVVDYNHGNATVPADVVGVVAGMVARTISIPAEAAAGITSQMVGQYQVQYAAWAVGGQVMLSPADKDTLNRYKSPRLGSILLLEG